METYPGPPRNVQIMTILPDLFNIMWEEPEEPNGVITGYKYEISGTPRDKKPGMKDFAGMISNLGMRLSLKSFFADSASPEVFATTINVICNQAVRNASKMVQSPEQTFQIFFPIMIIQSNCMLVIQLAFLKIQL